METRIAKPERPAVKLSCWGGNTGYTGDILGICWDNGKENGSYYVGFQGLGVRVYFGVRAWELRAEVYGLGLVGR